MANTFDQFDTQKTNAFDEFDASPAAAPVQNAPSLQKPAGFFEAAGRGFKRSLPETTSLLAGAGAAAAGLVGADSLRDKALAKYEQIQAEDVAPLQSKTTFTDVLDGKGSLGEWAGDTLGNFGGQGLQSLATAAAGAAAGSEVPVAGNIVGAVLGGTVGKATLKKVVGTKVAEMLAEKAATAEGRKQLGRAAAGLAASTALNTAQETGIAYTGRAEDAKAAGEQLGAGDSVRAIAAGVPAGLLDTAAEAVGVGRLFKGASASPSLVKRVLAGATKGALTEGATEGAQAALERAGAGQALTGGEAYRDYIENVAAGALGGGVMGGGSGLRRQTEEGAPTSEPQPGARPTLALPAPRTFAVSPDGTVTPNQPSPEPEVIAPATMRFPQGRGMSTSLTRPQRFPDAQPGSLADAANALDDTMPGDAQPVIEGQATRIEPVLPAPASPDPETGAPGAWSPEQIGAYLTEQARQSPGSLPTVNTIAETYGLTKRAASELRRASLIVAKTAPAETTDATLPRGSEPAGTGDAAPLDLGSGGNDGAPGAAPGSLEEAASTAQPVEAAAAEPVGEAGLSPAPEAPVYDESADLLEGDITPPSGGVFENEGAAQVQAKRVEGGRVMPVDGGFVVRTPVSGAEAGRSQAPKSDDSSSALLPSAPENAPERASNSLGSAAPAPALPGQEAQAEAAPPAESQAVEIPETATTPNVAHPAAGQKEAPTQQAGTRAPTTATQLATVAQPLASPPAKGQLPAAGEVQETAETGASPSPQATPAQTPPQGGVSASGKAAGAAGTPRPKVRTVKGVKRYQEGHPDTIRAYFQPGALVSGYGGGTDRVLGLDMDASGTWSARVIRVNKDGSPRPEERERSHHTIPSQRELVAVLGKAADQPARARATAKAAPAPDAGQQSEQNTIPAPKRPPLSVRMGGQEYPVASYEDASRKFLALKEATDIGGMRVVELLDEGGNVVGYIHQNGSVYGGHYRNPDKSAPPLYAPPSAGRRPLNDDETTDDTKKLADKAEPTSIADAAHEAATSPNNDLPHPTEAQKEAGNYKKGHVSINGLDISIENPAGSRRRPEWPALKNHYGYFKGSVGADKDHVDVFMSDDAGNADLPVFVVDQRYANGRFDEHKVMLGFPNEEAARAAYLSNYEKGWNGLKAITRMSLDEFKAWLADPAKTKQPAAVPNEKIEDFGEKLHGARKDYAAEYAERLSDAKEIDVATQPLSKSWPEPQYQQMLDAGANPWTVAFIRTARDSIPNKPAKAWKLKGWVEQVASLRALASDMLGDASLQERARTMYESEPFAGLRAKMDGLRELYQTFGHAVSLKGISFAKHSYTFYKGDRNVTKWSIDRAAKATAFSNWPQELAVADTKEEALERFKPVYDKMVADKEGAKPEEKAPTRFDIYSRRSAPGKFIIGKKIGKDHVDIATFDSVKAAREYLAENNAELVAKLDRLKNIPNERRATNSPRVGADHRDGADVTPEQFSEAFGFRGVQFGNYVEGPRRQQDLNQAYDALMDLAGVLGIEPRALSLNGSLGLAFGARGKGGKNPPAAHFEPDRIVINLTKNAGAGSLAHEWFHGLDNYFSRQRGLKHEYVTNDPKELRDRSGIRPEMLAAFNRIMVAIDQSGLRMRSEKLDQVRSKPYWSTKLEMAARSFENYVIAKLQDQNASNDYLANIVDDQAWARAYAGVLAKDGTADTENSYPYLTPAEVPAVRAAFDEFFQTIESEQTPEGNTRLFSRPDEPKSGAKAEDIRSAVDSLVERWRAAPGIFVVDTASELPEKVRAAKKWEGFEGFYDDETGKVYLVAENLADTAHALRILAHETVGHYGMEQITGPELWASITDTVGRMDKSGKYAELFSEIRRRYRGANQSIFVREAVAVMAEKGMHNSVIDRVVAAMAKFLRALGFDIQFTNAELRAQIGKAARYVRNGSRPRVAQATQLSAGFAARPDRNWDAEVQIVGIAGGAFGDTKNDLTAARAAARDYLRKIRDSGKQMLNVDTGWKIGLSRAGINELVQFDAEKLNLLVALPRITRTAILADTAPNRDPSPGDSIVAFHTLYAPVRLNGDLKIARLVVREHQDGQFAYDLQQSDILEEKGPAGSVRFPDIDAGAQRPSEARGMTVRQLRDAVNAVDRPGWNFSQPDSVQTEAFKKWFGDSKVTNPDGTPRVVYHGTSEGFWTFDPAKLGGATAHMTAPLGFYFDERWSHAQRYAENASGGVPADERVIDVFLSIKNPKTMTLDEFLQIDDRDQAIALRDRLQSEGYDGIHLAENNQWVAFSPTQIKSASENTGAYSATNSDMRFSRPDPEAKEGAGLRDRMNAKARAALDVVDRVSGGKREFPEHWDAAQRAAAEKFATFAPRDTLAQKFDKVKSRAGEVLVQRIFDQFRPLRNLSEEAFMQAHLSKAADGALEASFEHGVPVLRDGAYAIDDRDGGLRAILSKLGGEHDQMLMWMVGNRAERLKAEGREQLFSDDDIKAMKRMNEGVMADGRSRKGVYREAMKEINRYNKAFLDIAEKAGVVNADARKVWEDEFYIPFYREMEKGPDLGPGQADGLLRQRVIERLVGGNDIMGDPLENMMANWSHMLEASMRNMAANKALDQAFGLGAAKKLENPTKKSVWTMREGKQVHWEVDDKLVLEALEALNFSGYDNPLMRAAGKFKRMLTIGVTASPSFRIRNMIRDSLSALGTAEVGYNPIKNAIDGWRSTAKDNDTQVALMAGGGAVRFGSFNDGDQAAHAKRLIAMGVQENQILDTQDKVKNAFRRLFDKWQEVGDRAETINRAVIYNRAIAQGKTHLQASFEARDLMNFTSMGSSAAVRALTQVLPFFNARLQGLDRLARGASRDPRRFAAVAGVIGMASAALFLLNKDDDDYKALPDYVRDTYWPIKLGGKWLYLPKPFEIGAFGTVVERFTELATAGDDYQARDFANTLLGVLNSQLAMNPVPQIARPITEAAFNYDVFRGAPIDSLAQQRLLPQDRFTARTSAPAVAAGQVLRMSPQKIEHVLTGYFGWLGLQALNVGDWMARGAMGMPSSPNQDLTKTNNLFVVGDFVKEAGSTSSKYVTRFYDMQRDIDAVYASATQARKAGDFDRTRELLDDPRLRMRPLFRNADKQIDKINQQIRAVTNDTNLSAGEKSKRLENLQDRRNEVARRVDAAARAAGY